MLHLLDPAGYPLEDRLAFRKRIEGRQAVAEALLDLTDDASEYFAADAIDRIAGIFEGDPRLEALSARVREHLPLPTSTPKRIDAIRALRVHLSETYRLHRRLLRTRRDDPRVQAYLPKRNGVTLVEHGDEARQEAFDLLESWRLALPSTATQESGGKYAELFSRWVVAALSHPIVLLRQIDERIASLRASLPGDFGLRDAPAFPEEERFLVERRTLLAEAAKIDRRAIRLAAWLRASIDVKKAIVFVDDRQVAENVAKILRDAIGPQAVVRHDGTSEAVRAFENYRQLAVLVCDRSAEEGLNLQRHGATVVHFDLPLEPARLEQRIGRVDRLEARGQMRNVALLTTSLYERDWFECVRSAIRVFERSIAPLQYVLVESTARIRSKLLVEGAAAIEQEAATLLEPDQGLEAELRRIRAQEAIDAVEADADGAAAFFQSLSEADEASETEGERALNAWAVDQLQFRCQRPEPNVVQYLHDLRRPTLVPLFDSYRLFRRCIDRSPRAGRERSVLPMEVATFGRAVSEAKTIGLLRVGHPFVDAMESLVRSDDRGAAFAMWRYVPRSTRIPRLFLRFDFVIEADLSTLSPTLAAQLSLPSLRRRVDRAFPIRYRTVWLNADLEPVSHPRVLEVLQRPYRKEPQRDGSRDVNLRHERWERVDALVPAVDWSDLCHRARRTAEAIVRSESTLVEDCRRYAAATLEAAIRVDDSLKSRVARLSGAAREAEQSAAVVEMELSRCLASGIERPSLRVDSAGAVFLASEPLNDA